jgi:hypothetical protein
MAADRQLVVSLLIGTNNLHLGGHTPTQAANGVMAVARVLLERSRARLLVNALLPRQDRNSSYLAAVGLVNAQLSGRVEALRRIYPDRVAFADCRVSRLERRRRDARSERSRLDSRWRKAAASSGWPEHPRPWWTRG